MEVLVECALGAGAAAEVVEPAELRDRVASEAGAVARRILPE